jgi:hypothetical protein
MRFVYDVLGFLYFFGGELQIFIDHLLGMPRTFCGGYPLQSFFLSSIPHLIAGPLLSRRSLSVYLLSTFIMH